MRLAPWALVLAGLASVTLLACGSSDELDPPMLGDCMTCGRAALATTGVGPAPAQDAGTDDASGDFDATDLADAIDIVDVGVPSFDAGDALDIVDVGASATPVP